MSREGVDIPGKSNFGIMKRSNYKDNLEVKEIHQEQADSLAKARNDNHGISHAFIEKLGIFKV